MRGRNRSLACPVVLMKGYHWFFTIYFALRVCTCGGDASPWRLCVLTAALRSWCMSLEVFCTMKARVKLILCCVQLSCPSLTREMVSRKDWFSATVSSFRPFPSSFSYLLHLVITLCCNGLCWVGSVLGFVAEHSEGQTLNYSTVNIHFWEKELKFLIVQSLWLRFGQTEVTSEFSEEKFV